MAGTNLSAMHEALTDSGQPTLAEWPFDPAASDPQHPPLSAPSSPWTRGELAILSPTASVIEQELRAGRAPVVGLRLARQCWNVDADGLIPPIPRTDADLGGHAMVAVAIGRHPLAGQVIALRNSWGTGWGSGGYAWIDINTLENRLLAVARAMPR